MKEGFTIQFGNFNSNMKELINDVVPGNVLVIVSGIESDNVTTPDFDCSLATESMFVAAHGVGLGARIYGSPIGNINSKKELFQIPPGYKVVMVLSIGNTDKNVYIVLAATPGMKFEELVNFKK